MQDILFLNVFSTIYIEILRIREIYIIFIISYVEVYVNSNWALQQ